MLAVSASAASFWLEEKLYSLLEVVQKTKKTSNLQGEMFKVNLEIAKNLKRSNKASRFEVSSPCKGGYKLIIVFCAKFVMYVRH